MLLLVVAATLVVTAAAVVDINQLILNEYLVLAPLDCGPCVSWRRFVHFVLKCTPLPRKTITAQSVTFVVVPLDGDFAWEVLNKWASAALRDVTSFLRGAETSNHCRRFGS